MKKWFPLTLAALTVLGLLTGCNSSDSAGSAEQATPSASSPATTSGGSSDQIGSQEAQHQKAMAADEGK